MIRAFSRSAAVATIAAAMACCVAHPAQAALMADPAVLYDRMKAAYAKDAQAGWTFRAQATYLSTIFDAGRAYSLQYPNDPNYAVLARLTVQIGSGLHYNPLTNHDGTMWWVREAADWTMKNAQDFTLVSQAQALLARVNADDDPEQLARYADEDATANVRAYPGDVDALLQQVEANWRAWLLTRDPAWRSLALRRAAAANFPVAHLPTTWGNELVSAANNASTDRGYTDADVTNAQSFLARLKAVDPLRVITTVTALPHDVYLTTLAPADEYFGPMGMSILGIENELKRINFMLNYNYGNRESDRGFQVAKSIVAMQEVYPKDRDLPMLLLWSYRTEERMTDQQSHRAAGQLRAILTIEYQDSPQARQLLRPSMSSG